VWTTQLGECYTSDCLETCIAHRSPGRQRRMGLGIGTILPRSTAGTELGLTGNAAHMKLQDIMIHNLCCTPLLSIVWCLIFYLCSFISFLSYYFQQPLIYSFAVLKRSHMANISFSHMSFSSGVQDGSSHTTGRQELHVKLLTTIEPDQYNIQGHRTTDAQKLLSPAVRLL